METSLKPYYAPELIVHGDVEEITLQGARLTKTCPPALTIVPFPILLPDVSVRIDQPRDFRPIEHRVGSLLACAKGVEESRRVLAFELQSISMS